MSRLGRLTVLLCALTGACDGMPSRSPAKETAATAPDTIIIDGNVPSCATCTLTVSHIASLGGPSDPEIHRHLPDVIRDSRGYYYAGAHGWSNDLILRYDSAGRYLGTLGSRGNGPGEYTMSMETFVGPGDSVFVLTWRLDVLVYAPTGTYARVFRMSPGKRPLGMIPGTGGAMYAAGDQRPWMVDGRLHAHIINADGSPRDSFAVFSARSIVPRDPMVGDDGFVWTLTESNYRLERHARDGTPAQLIGVTSPSFPERPVMSRVEADSLALQRRPVHTTVTTREQALRRLIETKKLHGRVDANGLAWVTTQVSAPAWEKQSVMMLRESDEAPMENLLAPDEESALRNTIVEVIDTRRGQLLARTQLPFGAQLFAPGLLARPTSDANGHLRMEIHRVTLTRR